MAMQFPPNVERWRATVAKYFPPELVDKALYVIQYESGGNPAAAGDGGVARGLFQIQDNRNFPDRPDAGWLDNPENNIRYAAQNLGAASGNFSAWGEGSTYQGKPFGALGNHPFPGGGTQGGTGMPGGRNYDDPEVDAEYEKLKRAFLTARGDVDDPNSPKGKAFWAMEAFETRFGKPRSDFTDYDPAQQEFDNRIALGDFNDRQSQSAFGRWFAKYQAAKEQTNDKIEAAREHNRSNAEMQAARAQSSTPGLLPRPLDAGAIEPAYDPTMEKYLSKLGITEQAPEYEGAGFGLPGSGPYAPTTGAGSKPPAQMGWQGPLLPDGRKYSGLEDQRAAGESFFRNEGAALDRRLGQPASPNPWEQITGGFSDMWSSITGAPSDVRGAISGANKAKKKGKKWWQRGFAEGGQNIPAQRAWVGEGGQPEIMEVPGFGSKMVGMNGPVEVDIPEGANITPLDEAYMYHQIQQKVKQGPMADQVRQQRERQMRMSHPNPGQAAKEAMRKVMAQRMAANPPPTPMLEPGVPDLWAPWRALTGTPAYQEQMEQQQQGTKTGGGSRV